jgi:plasmid stabilization system protein ParE
LKIKHLTYQAVKNLGNYSSERLEMSAEVEDGEDPDEAAHDLRRRVNWILAAPPEMGKPREDPPDELPEDF